MLKFKNLSDKDLFLHELYENEYDRVVHEIDENSDSILEAQKYITAKRSNFSTRLVDFRKSQNQKAAWRANKYKYLKGIKEFARSVAGKQFHRSLSRYLVSRGILRGSKDQRPINPRNPTTPGASQQEEYIPGLGRYEAPDLLVSLSSLRTHLLIETRYYQPISDEVDFFLLLEVLVEKLNEIESRILESMISYKDFDPTKDDIDFLEAVVGGIDTELIN